MSRSSLTVPRHHDWRNTVSFGLFFDVLGMVVRVVVALSDVLPCLCLLV